MPRYEMVLRVFVSSPGDVNEERVALEDVVRDLNKSLTGHLGARFDLVRWETDVEPGVGDEPQAVINAQIGADYDIFIGILWKHFGTPTKTAGSGTEAEFRLALERCRNNPDTLRVLFYFKTAPPPSLKD